MSKKNIFLLIIIISSLVSSCELILPPTKEPVLISSFTAPIEVPYNFGFNIELTATAPDGCWSDIEIFMERENEFNYHFRALGLFSGDEICPTVLVEKDTSIYFRPKFKGNYYFHINVDEPFDKYVFALVVK